jgi:RNA 2',3'-cyclic 3'-phosphodiesterase
MASTSRTFIAFTIPDVQRTRLGRLQGLIAPEIPKARWVTPEMFHVTLAFLGDVPDVDLNVVCRAVAEASQGFKPFTVNLQSLGAFPDPSRPRVVWVGLTGSGMDTLVDLQQDIVQAISDAGYPPEDNRFNPHLTLGYVKTKKGEDIDINHLIAHYRMWSAGNFQVSGVVTFSSTQTPEGPAYMALATSALR